MSVPIRRRGVYWIPDSAVQLPPNAKRTLHPKRPFLVISGDETNEDQEWPLVLGFPLTTGAFVSEFDVALSKGDAGLPDDCFVQVALLQPIAKSKLQEWIGNVDANNFEKVCTNLLTYAALLD